MQMRERQGCHADGGMEAGAPLHRQDMQMGDARGVAYQFVFNSEHCFLGPQTCTCWLQECGVHTQHPEKPASQAAACGVEGCVFGPARTCNGKGWGGRMADGQMDRWTGRRDTQNLFSELTPRRASGARAGGSREEERERKVSARPSPRGLLTSDMTCRTEGVWEATQEGAGDKATPSPLPSPLANTAET